MFSPLTGRYINTDEICTEDKIKTTESIKDKLLESRINIEEITNLVNDGVDVFNISSPFYNDICYKYNFTRDVPLKDRVHEFFPNISFCEEGCDLKGINMTTITSICECFYKESKRKENLKNKVLEQTQFGIASEMISSSNIYVIKCIKLVFDSKILKTCYGGFVIFCLILAEIVCTLFYFLRNIYSVNKYIFVITNKYIDYLLKQKSTKKDEIHSIKNIKKLTVTKNSINNNAPPKHNFTNKKFFGKTRKPRNTTINGNINLFINRNQNMYLKNNLDKNNNINIKPNNNVINKNREYIKIPRKSSAYSGELSNSSGKDLVPNKKSELINELNGVFINIKDDLDIDIEKYLQTQYDEMDYDEAIRKDKRKFGECFTEKLRNDQIIINTFFSDEALKPRSIKIILFILQFNLYFFINGLFYDEEYISKIYHLEKDTFFTMAERFFDNLLYAAFAGIIINYIIEFFFIEEIKIKKILKMEKDEIFIIKYQMINLLKSIRKRYILFIIISFIISFVALIHIFCFNAVYYHTMKEWVAFSFIIILSIQLLSFLICFIQTALRFISFKFKSEKLFKLSL